MEFDLPKDQSSIIKVIGVGGGGSNAVSHMYEQGIKGVDFLICNTDAQALERSPVPNKIQLGTALTEGRGAGSIAEVGENAALESIDEIKEILSKNTKMVFIAAGMGGGTGTGAAPVIAKVAKEMGILTVGIVTYPFNFEGRKRKHQAEAGLEQLKENVDTYLVINNDKLREIHGNLSLSTAFSKADDILAVAAKGIAEIITVTGYVNVDFEDVKTVMNNSGAAIMGSAVAAGENRSIDAVRGALESPLLNDSEIEGANYILLYISSGTDDISMDEMSEITDYVQDEAGLTADVIWGMGTDETLGDSISVTLVATGFEANKESKMDIATGRVKVQEKVVHSLEDSVPQAPVNKTEEPKNETLFTQDLEPQRNDTTGKVTFDLNDDNYSKRTNNTENLSRHNISHTVNPNGGEERVLRHDLLNEEPANQTEELNDDLSTDVTAETELNVEARIEETPATYNKPVDQEEQLRKSQERIARLKNLARKIKSPSAMTELENVPAYKRRNVKLDDVPHSSDQQESRYTISDKTDDSGIRPNNSYLHDNVD
jgi:cell division protein FtsZ